MREEEREREGAREGRRRGVLAKLVVPFTGNKITLEVFYLANTVNSQTPPSVPSFILYIK